MAERIIDIPTEKMRTDLRFWLRERIVRCRDCRYCMSYWKSDYCDYFSYVTNNSDGFCAWGERKEDESE